MAGIDVTSTPFDRSALIEMNRLFLSEHLVRQLVFGHASIKVRLFSIGEIGAAKVEASRAVLVSHRRKLVPRELPEFSLIPCVSHVSILDECS